MINNLPKILTFIFCLFFHPIFAQEIWKEDFLVPGKGIWGSEDGTSIEKDFTEITTWTLEYAAIVLASPDDYAKTVSTSGGRFEVRDITGEILWRSEWISVSLYQNITVQLTASETGSGTNKETKYLNAFYSIDNGNETRFETNGENSGNWGSVVAEQNKLNGDSLQIIIKISNSYSSDKVILDEVRVFAEEKTYPPSEPGDLAINEVLFNPFPEGEDFVEIYNRSEKEFPLNKLHLASRDEDGQLTQICNLAGAKYLLQPKNYLALTKDTSKVLPFYFIECSDCFQQTSKFPSFNNDEDVVVLLNENGVIIDEFYYSEKRHHPFLSDVDGVSLERISLTVSTNDAENWASASTESGYATPGYKNSQTENANTEEPVFTFAPDAFSPNSDGYNDEYQIDYLLKNPGFVANVTVFDSKGRLVCQLVKNEILGTHGKITWNGEDETGQRQPLGVYIVTLEIFNTEGKIYRFKDGVVLTGILE